MGGNRALSSSPPHRRSYSPTSSATRQYAPPGWTPTAAQRRPALAGGAGAICGGSASVGLPAWTARAGRNAPRVPHLGVLTAAHGGEQLSRTEDPASCPSRFLRSPAHCPRYPCVRHAL